jgi:hypothetical protein
MRRAAAVLLLAAALSGCGEREAVEDTSVAQAVPPAPASAPAPAVPGAAVSGVAAAASAEREPEPAGASTNVALDGEGLRFVDPERGSTRLLAFDAPADQAVAALERSQGGPPTRWVNAECGAGPVEFAAWPDGLSILIQNGRFVGWALGERATRDAPTTMSGVGVGSTRAELERPYQVSVEQTSLGTEFSTAGFFGLLSSAGPDARVSSLWAGVSCNFR